MQRYHVIIGIPTYAPTEKIFGRSTNYVIRGINVMIAIDLEIHDNAFFEDEIIIPPWKNWRTVETANVLRRFRENV